MLTKRSLKQQKQHDVLHKIMWRTVLKFLNKIYSTKLSRYFVLFNYKKLICSVNAIVAHMSDVVPGPHAKYI